LCRQCFDDESKEQKEHISRHQFGSFLIVHENKYSDDVEEAVRNLFACESCPESESFQYLLQYLPKAVIRSQKIVMSQEKFTNVASEFGVDEVNLHPHLHFKFVIYPVIAEIIRRENYKKCHGKEFRMKSVQGHFGSPTRLNCIFCGHGTFQISELRRTLPFR
jgi:hypothetical protein